MKTFICAALVVVYAMYAIGEQCRTINDCMMTMCDANSSHIVCEKERCVCDANGVKCMDQMTCSNMGSCHKHDEHYHCLDGECVCLKDGALPGHGPEHGPHGPH